MKKIISLALAMVLLATLLIAVPVSAEEKTTEFEITSISHAGLNSYKMFVGNETYGRNFTLFPYGYKENKDVTKLLSDLLVGRKVEVTIEDYDNDYILDDAIYKWKLLPTDEEKEIKLKEKFELERKVWDILMEYSDPEFLGLIKKYFKPGVTNTAPFSLSKITGPAEAKKIQTQIKDLYKIDVNVVYKEETESIDILPTKEDEYEWDGIQMTRIGIYVVRAGLRDKFNFVIDYRWEDISSFGIRDVMRIEPSQYKK